MGTVTIVPSAVVEDVGGRTIVGTGSLLTAMNDGSDSTYVHNNLSGSPFEALFIFPTLVGVIPADSHVEAIQLRFRYSHAVPVTPLNNHEIIKAETVAVGKPVGSTHTIYTYTPAEILGGSFQGGSTIREWTSPKRSIGIQGVHLNDMLLLLNSRLYGKIRTSRKVVHNTARIYSFSLVVHYNEMPMVTLVDPTGTITVSRPPLNWTFADAEENPQQRRQVKIFTEAETLLGGFDPDTSPNVYESSAVTVSKTHTPAKSFGVNGNYVAYARAAHYPIGDTIMWSEWDNNPFTLNVPSPSAPTCVAVYQADQNAILVTSQGKENMLTYALASFEHDPATNPPSWVAGASTTVTRTQAATAEPDGTWAISLTRTGTTGTASADLPAAMDTEFGIPVMVGNTYQGRAKFRTAVTGRSCQVAIEWLNVNGGIISVTTGSAITDTTSGWTEATVSGAAPANAVWAQLRIEILAVVVGEIHYVDTLGLFPGTVSVWTQGGFAHENHHMPLQRSLDAEVTWEDIESFDFFHDPIEQKLEFWDYEVPSGATAHYRVRIETVNQDFDTVASPYSTTANATMPQFETWWLRDLESPGELSMAFHVTECTISVPKPQTTHWPLGETFPVVSHDGVKADTLSLRALLLTEDDYHMFREMVASGNTLLLQDVLGRQWFVQSGDGIQYDHFMAQPLEDENWPIRHAHTVELEFQSVARPAGSPVGVGQAAHHG